MKTQKQIEEFRKNLQSFPDPNRGTKAWIQALNWVLENTGEKPE